MSATIHSFWTVVMLASFVGIVIWAWSSRRKGEFDDAAKMILDDSDLEGPSKASETPSAEESKGEK